MRLVVLAVVVGAGAGLTGCDRGGDPPTSTAPGVIEANAVIDRVIDGDTVDVFIDGTEERVRLIGIDTPEVAHAGSPQRPGNAAECFGPEAAAFTSTLLAVGTPVRLERDVVARDDYGRVLAYVYRASDGLFVNDELIRRGYAQTLSIRPNTAYAERFVEAARQAERADLGLWSACR